MDNDLLWIRILITTRDNFTEDIDLVQIKGEPFGPVMDRLRECLSFLGTPNRNQKAHNNTMVYKMESEGGQKMKLKIEVNTREHFTVFGYQEVPFEVASSWHASHCHLTTFSLNELLSTKLRALYQRRKGRDLFDLWYALTKLDCDPEKIVESWRRYLKEEGNTISRAEFELNLENKLYSDQFMHDMSFLIRAGIQYEVPVAMNLVRKQIIELI